MAPGSQKWNGTSADLVSAPTSSSTTAVTTYAEPTPPAPAAASTPDSENVAYRTPSRTMPVSIASPPKVVTTSAVSAARRLAAKRGLCPTSR